MVAAGAARPRDAFIDGLRGLALGGVLVVNTMSFPHVFSSPVGVVEPADSSLALAVHALCAALFQAKSYPLLMFLVGYGWAMRSRSHGRRLPSALRDARRAQMLRQGALGVVHGLFIYFGDILSWLALLGLLLLGAPRRRLRDLLRRFWLFSALWLSLGGSTLLWLALADEALPGRAHWLTDAAGWPEVFALQRLAYASYLFQVPWQLPMMLALGTLGVIGGRLRVLERARAGARLWAFGVVWLLPAGVVANLALAAVLVVRQQEALGAQALAGMPAAAAMGDFTLGDMASQFAGPLLGAGIVCWLARAWQRGGVRWLEAFAPLGRMTMSGYVVHSTACLVLFAGPALALAPAFGSIGLFAFGLAYWALALALAPRWLAYAGIGPLERWVRGAGGGVARASRRNTIT